ncbi:hypothetical protein GFO_2630 [Christiangramia forsetii KT0803]|uniref:Uncharacterized protein n=1 Tax=Christiangramia forsetii (strain DSM 17595 / CGMCC 1.15422 / KT0803) TaxID=411154 RepID=A0M4P1_CHRFK|nr:hypothetical protein GFO_2630 [Christiangramia forsetii KT0803]
MVLLILGRKFTYNPHFFQGLSKNIPSIVLEFLLGVNVVMGLARVVNLDKKRRILFLEKWKNLLF